VLIGLNILALLAVLLYLFLQMRKPTDAVRVRNAFLARPGEPSDFDWTPDRVPADFRVETDPPRPELVAIVRGLALPEGAWERATGLAAHLVEHAGSRGPIQADPLTTYRRIREGYGYCADHVRAFLALAHAAGVFARQWAFSFDGFGGHGHTVVEIYDPRRRKWLFLDVHNNFHAVNPVTGEPLGALEFRAAVASPDRPVRIVKNGPGRPGFVHEPKLFEYYRRGLDEWYLWWGNAVIAQAHRPWVKAAAGASRHLAHLLANVVGAVPRIRLCASDENAGRVRSLAALRTRVTVAAALMFVLAGTLVLQLATRGTSG
jgi:hypothetical protein